MSGMGGLQLGPIRWQGKANGKPVPLVESTLPLQQVGTHQNNPGGARAMLSLACKPYEVCTLFVWLQQASRQAQHTCFCC